MYQDPDSDRYLIPSERVFDNAADDLETIAVSKRFDKPVAAERGSQD